jgi:hypothetical protein
LAGTPQECDAADVDLLDHARVVQLPAAFLERVERDRHEVQRQQASRLHLGHVVCRAAPREDGCVHVRVQRLDAAAQHLSEAGPLSTAVTGTPACSRNAAVPPEARMTVPPFASSEANSAAPLLSESDNSAARGQPVTPVGEAGACGCVPALIEHSR